MNNITDCDVVNKPRVVATLTTMPGRYDKLIHTVKSLYDQVDIIYLALPPMVRRLKQSYPPLPDEITRYVTIVPTLDDYGPITKLLGALNTEKDPNTLILSVDDDMIYPPDLVEKLVANLQHQPNAVIATGGYTFSNSFFHFMLYHNKFPWLHRWMFPHVPENGKQIEQIYGCSGVLYRRAYFPDNGVKELLLKSQENIDNFLNDDVVISAWLARNHIPVYIFNNFSPCQEMNTIRDGNELSYIPFKMYYSMHRAYQHLQEWGFNYLSLDHSFSDSIFGTILIILFLLIFIIFLISLVLYLRKRHRKTVNKNNNIE